MGRSGTYSATTPAALTVAPMRVAYDEARATAIEQFSRSNRVEPLWKALTRATDELIASCCKNKAVTVIAVGGYGRGELSPHSDIDLLVLITAEHGAVAEQASMKLLRDLWDMGLTVGHATRTIQETIEAARTDPSIATALLDARLVAGNETLARVLTKRLRQEVFTGSASHYVNAKLVDRDTRHAKWGDSRFMLEPHIKEGKGALRDLQTLDWIQGFCGKKLPLLTDEEWRAHSNAYHFLSAIRAHMHVLRGRADERLTFDLQMEIAARMKFPGRTPQQKAEKLMRRYFQCTRQSGMLTRSVCAALEEANLRPSPLGPAGKSEPITLPEGFALDSGRLHFAAEDALEEHAPRAVQLFAIAAQHQLDIHPHAYRMLAHALPVLSRRLMFEGEANRYFLELLTGKSPELHLRRMNDAGILGALIPEFERVIGMMQYDGYHTYTVDEHILVAVGNLALIEQGEWAEQMPIATRVVHEIAERTALYLAVFCHDLAKGTGGEHAKKGAVVMQQLARRMGLSAASTEMACWLVMHQELISDVAFKRNLEEPKTIADFVAEVQSPERLKLLLLLSVADINAVGPTIWNGWKGALIRALYGQALSAMGVQGQTSRAQALLPSTAEVYAAWERAPDEPALSITHDQFHAVTDITCCMRYTHTVFRNLAGVLSYLGASIVKAKIHVLGGDAALMLVGIQDIAGNSFAQEEERLEKLATLMKRAEQGQLNLARELPRRRMVSKGREVDVAPAVFIDNRVSADASVVEVNARDRLGLLYDILQAMEACDLQVMSAQLATYGSKAVDVFYVKDAYGHKLIHRARQAFVQKELLQVCTPKEGAA